MILYRVDLSRVEKSLRYKIPYEIVEKVHIWVLRVELDGMNKTRLIKSYHDEPLKGARVGERSIRLNRKYRLIYRELFKGYVVVEVLEVNAHEY